MNFPSIVILALVGIAVIVAVILLIRNRGASCSSCSGKCAGCSRNKSK